MKLPLHGSALGRALIAPIAVWLAGSVALCAFPITWVPGFGHALALNLLTGTVGLWLAVSVGSRARRIAAERDGTAPRFEHFPVAAPFLFTTAVLATLIATSFAISLTNGLRVGLCEVGSSISFYLALPLGSAPLVAALGTGVAAVSRRWWSAGLLASGALLVTLLSTAWPIVTGPQVFAFNHLLGHLPGPIYDERAAVDGAVIGWRGLTLGWTALIMGGLGLLGAPRRPSAPRSHVGSVPAAWILLLIGATAIVALNGARTKIGFHQTHRSVASALGGVMKTEHFVIYFPEERGADWIERVARDHEYQYAVVSEWLELEPREGTPVRSYVFRSQAEKGRLTGAERTSIAKPWLRAMYLNDGPYPHRILRHELVHVVAAAFGSPPFGASGRGLFFVNTGLVEGLAVAADWPADQLSVHGWARAMRDIGVAPDIRGLFSASGFLTQSSSTAYTLAGSFVRWVAETHGVEAVKDAYRQGCLSAIADPEDLFASWERFLGERDLDDDAARLAEHRFRRPSILRRPCAFDVTHARDQGRRALRAGRFEEARRWFSRAMALEPQDPWHEKGLLDALLAEGRAEAEQVARSLLEHENADMRLKAEADMALGDLAWRAGHLERAETHYREALEASFGAASARLAAAKVLAVRDPPLAAGLAPILMDETRRDLTLLMLRELLDEHDDEPLPHYLLGRHLFFAGERRRAIVHLREAAERGLSDKGGLRIEGLRLIARALYDEGEDLDEAERAWLTLAEDPAMGEGARLDALDWARRVRFLAGIP